MSYRNFTTTARRLIELVGKVSLSDVKSLNPANGDEWAASVFGVAGTVEGARFDVASYEIQGGKAHKSHKDPSDPKEVITLGFYNANGIRVGSAHAHLDGSFAFRESRAGRRG